MDGFDEISLERKEEMGKEIQQLARKYNQNFFIVSSRPENEFYSWNDFKVWSINPLSLEKACQLIEKLPVDSELKEKFLKDLKGKLFIEHLSFLSNSLLLSIMFLTYGTYADIPQKLSLFYQQAYETLFQKHDSLKGAFRRSRKSKLDSQDFAKVFATFSMLTYQDNKKQKFSESDVLKVLENCKHICNLDFEPKEFLFDVLQAVCLLIQDGFEISFSHRSFQEYFVAKFVVDSESQMREKILDKNLQIFMNDSVLTLIYELNSDFIEKKLFIPRLIEILTESEKSNEEDEQYVIYLKSCFSGIACYVYDYYPNYQLNFSEKENKSANLLGFILKRFNYNELTKNHPNIPEFYSEFERVNDLANLYDYYSMTSSSYPLPVFFVSIDELISNQNLFSLLRKDSTIVSFKAYKTLVKIKNILEEKHSNSLNLFEELFGIEF